MGGAKSSMSLGSWETHLGSRNTLLSIESEIPHSPGSCEDTGSQHRTSKFRCSCHVCHGQELDVFKFLSTLCKLSNTYQAKIIRPILQRNAATLLELKIFLNLANPKNVMSTQIQKPLNPPSLQIDDVAEDSARQRFANYETAREEC